MKKPAHRPPSHPVTLGLFDDEIRAMVAACEPRQKILAALGCYAAGADATAAAQAGVARPLGPIGDPGGGERGEGGAVKRASDDQRRRILNAYVSGNRRTAAWTDTDIAQLTRRYLAGESARVIALDLGRSAAAVAQQAAKLDLRRSPAAVAAANGARASQQRRPLHARFESHVQPEPNSGCWLWLGALDGHGYGQMRDEGRNRTATHVALQIAGRPIPQGLCALHRCDNPACVNPDHLFIGTHKDNSRDMMQKGRSLGPPVMRGESNNKAKLTCDLVRQIRARLATGDSLRKIGRDFGIRFSHVSLIKNRKVWSHVS